MSKAHPVEIIREWRQGVYRPGEDSSKLAIIAYETTCVACGTFVRFERVNVITGPNQATSRPTNPKCSACFRGGAR